MNVHRIHENVHDLCVHVHRTRVNVHGNRIYPGSCTSHPLYKPAGDSSQAIVFAVVFGALAHVLYTEYTISIPYIGVCHFGLTTEARR